MADKKGQVIIIKRKKGGHGGHHGGAWKVAYADFVTALMAFFLVMWLLGSDEEVKSAVEDYFNNPTSAWRKDLAVKNIVPLGDRTGAGESIISGQEGLVPEDMIERPSRIVASEGAPAVDPLDVLSNEATFTSLEMAHFSIYEDQVFRAGSVDEWAPNAEQLVAKIGKVIGAHRGKVAIRGSYEIKKIGGQIQDNYDLQNHRLVRLRDYLIERNLASEDRLRTVVSQQEAAETGARRKIHFVLSQAKAE